MTITELIKQLNAVKQSQGNLDVLVKTDNGTLVSPHPISFEISEGQYPEEWDIPKGLKFVLIDYGC